MSYFAAPTAWRKEKGTGGVLMINLSHEVDCLRHLFGNITRVYCEVGDSTRGFPVDETGAITLRFASGIVGTFVFSECARPFFVHLAFSLTTCPTSASPSPYFFEAATGENPLMPQAVSPFSNPLAPSRLLPC